MTSVLVPYVTSVITTSNIVHRIGNATWTKVGAQATGLSVDFKYTECNDKGLPHFAIVDSQNITCRFLDTFDLTNVLNTTLAASGVNNNTTFIYVPLVSDLYALYISGVTNDTYRIC